LLGISIFAAVITPSSDPYTMLAMMIPMYLFYEASIIIGRFLRRSRTPGSDDDMAIKSKSKGKAKQRSAARGPRHEPVPAPKPVAQRRWVQLTALFIAGILATVFVLWGWNGWRGYQDDHRAASELTTRQQALGKWKAVLEAQVSSIGQLQGN